MHGRKHPIIIIEDSVDQDDVISLLHEGNTHSILNTVDNSLMKNAIDKLSKKPLNKVRIRMTSQSKKSYGDGKPHAHDYHLFKQSSKNLRSTRSDTKLIRIGCCMIDVWYSSPFPPTVCTQPILFICEFCFKYMNSAYMAKSHQDKCQRKHPPGDEIYRDGSISIFEVDGRKNKLYCSNLCLLAKMFLDQKTLFYDVEPFLFYIMTERDHNGYHFIGYFSKEKSSTMSYNVSCILILPVFQKKGYGKYLIDFSYLLTRTEKKVGTPEKPLSLCGIRSYQSYWKYALYRYFLNDVNTHKSIEDISTDTGIIMDDVITTLARNNILVHDGHHYTLVIDENKMKRELEKVYNTGRLYVNADNLKWTPFGLNQERLARIINPFKE